MKFDIEDEATRRKKEKDKKNRKLKIIAIALLSLSVILLIIYFVTNRTTTTQSPVAPPQVIEEKQLQIVNENSNQRPIAVMIDNNIGDDKHAGLQDSYINYEIIVEGGLTRIMALYKDKDVNLIGPVRSSRHYFLDYALEHDAVYAHFGWSPYAERDIKALGVNNINGLTDSTPFARDPEIAQPHNVFTSTTKLRNYLQTKNYASESTNWKVLKYSVDEINLKPEEETTEQPTTTTDSNTNTETTPQSNTDSNLSTANKINIVYSYYQNRSYTYDSENKYYLRSMNGKAHLDKTTNNQLHFKNIIIMKVSNKQLDSEGRQDLTTTGSGTGYFITNGYALPIRWTKTSRNAKTIYTYTDGSEVKVNDGNTFIQIVPISSGVTIE